MVAETIMGMIFLVIQKKWNINLDAEISPIEEPKNPKHKLSVEVQYWNLFSVIKTMCASRKGRIPFKYWVLLSYFYIIIYDLSPEAETPPVYGCFTGAAKSWEMSITNFHGEYLPAHSLFSVLQTTKVLHNKAGEKEMWIECLCWQN